MTKLSLLGVAAIAACAALTAPAFAQHRATPALNAYAQGNVCGSRESGNPYNKDEDYMAWSAWRNRGGWDDRPDPNCAQIHPGHVGF